MTPSLFALHTHAILAVVAGAILLAFVRLGLGPTLADRVLALDLIGTAAVAFACAYALTYESEWALDVALFLTLVGFLGTAAFARYLAQPPEHER